MTVLSATGSERLTTVKFSSKIDITTLANRNTCHHLFPKKSSLPVNSCLHFSATTADVEIPVNTAVLKAVYRQGGNDTAELPGIVCLINKLSTLEPEPSSDLVKELERLRLK